jgi:hypothetical protein
MDNIQEIEKKEALEISQQNITPNALETRPTEPTAPLEPKINEKEIPTKEAPKAASEVEIVETSKQDILEAKPDTTNKDINEVIIDKPASHTEVKEESEIAKAVGGGDPVEVEDLLGNI